MIFDGLAVMMGNLLGGIITPSADSAPTSFSASSRALWPLSVVPDACLGEADGHRVLEVRWRRVGEHEEISTGDVLFACRIGFDDLADSRKQVGARRCCLHSCKWSLHVISMSFGSPPVSKIARAAPDIPAVCRMPILHRISTSQKSREVVRTLLRSTSLNRTQDFVMTFG